MKTVAIIGASNNRTKYGNKAVRAYARMGYTVFPVNPRESLVEGLPAYPSILDVPEPVDRAALYVPPSVGLGIVEQAAQKGVGELFLNPGSESPELIARAQELGVPVVQGCAILDIGESPGSL
jgi:predicted CoA-binding protein